MLRVGAGSVLPFCLLDPHEDALPMLRTGSWVARREGSWHQTCRLHGRGLMACALQLEFLYHFLAVGP